MAIDDPGAAFKFVGGRLCLDFINTVSGRLPNPGAGDRDYADVIEQERLVTFTDLMRWGQGANVLTAPQGVALGRAAHAAPARATQLIVRARVLREAMYRLFKAAVERWRPHPADLEVLNRELRRARTHERLGSEPRGFTWGWDAADTALDQVLWPVVRSAADLLTSDELRRVSQCDGEDCRWLFLDTSRNRRRRWCDMAECGNRAKVRRFRRRH